VCDRDPTTRRIRAHPPHPIFGPCLLWPNGWMDEDATWYGSRPRPRPHCISIHPVQFTCLTVILHNVCPSPLWSTSWSGALHFIAYSIHFFTKTLSSFCHTCPYHRNLFCCSTKIISSISSTYLNSLLGTLSFTLTSHIHLTILISAR